MLYFYMYVYKFPMVENTFKNGNRVQFTSFSESVDCVKIN